LHKQSSKTFENPIDLSKTMQTLCDRLHSEKRSLQQT